MNHSLLQIIEGGFLNGVYAFSAVFGFVWSAVTVAIGCTVSSACVVACLQWLQRRRTRR